MLRIHPLNRSGISALENVALLAVMSIAVLACTNFIKLPYGSKGFDFLMSKRLVWLLKQARDNASLVVVGKIINMDNQMQELTEHGKNVVVIYGIWTLEVESVEKGRYPENKIDFFLGWKSNFSAPEEFPAGVKSHYGFGERVRVFLSYGIPGEGLTGPGYFTPNAYYCVEPLDN